MKHIVTCRLCKQQFDTEKEEWVMPSVNYYYHAECYHIMRDDKREKGDDEWRDLIFDFISHSLNGDYDYHVINGQLTNYTTKKKYTCKGIYFALKYFYEIKHNDWNRGNGGIGIVPYVYDESKKYWEDLERRSIGTMAAIERQIKERSGRRVVEITQRTGAKKDPKWSLEDI